MHQRVLALKPHAPVDADPSRLAELVRRWAGTPTESEVSERDNGGKTLVFRFGDAGDVQFLVEPDYPYVLARLVGRPDWVGGIVDGAAGDVWTRDELLVEATRSDPPRASLLPTIGLVSEALDHETVEIFVRALEAEDSNARKQAVVAISFVPALAFAPALRVSIQSERDDRLRSMMENVLQMCEG